MNQNIAGYPEPPKNCASNPNNSGKCDGFLYRQYAKVTTVYTNVAYHRFDVQEGQSGGPIYVKDGNDRTAYLLHTKSGYGFACAMKLKSGSYGSICDWIGNFPSSHFSNPSC